MSKSWLCVSLFFRISMRRSKRSTTSSKPSLTTPMSSNSSGCTTRRTWSVEINCGSCWRYEHLLYLNRKATVCLPQPVYLTETWNSFGLLCCGCAVQTKTVYNMSRQVYAAVTKSGQGLCNSLSHHGQPMSLPTGHLGDLVAGQQHGCVGGWGELAWHGQQGFLFTGAVTHSRLEHEPRCLL